MRGKVIDITEDGVATVKVEVDLNEFIHKGVKEVEVTLIDPRPLSDKQRKMCYALIGAIADYVGDSKQRIKELFKLEFQREHIEELGESLFSLSNAPMSLVCEFQRYLIDFIVSEDVPCSFPLLDYVDDTEAYVHTCVLHKKCCICGKRADLHHMDAIGMGNDRDKAEHLGREVMSLCREHHTECHTIGRKEFLERYHLNGGVIADRSILRVYGLKK